MEPFLARVVAEKRALDGNIARLDAYMALPIFGNLERSSRMLLHRQRAAMGEYTSALAERLAAIDSVD